MFNKHSTPRVLKHVKNYTIFPIVWLNEVRYIFKNRLICSVSATTLAFSTPNVYPKPYFTFQTLTLQP